MQTLGNITLHNADCMDLLRQMPDKAFDLAIVDPPYGLPQDSSMGSGSIAIACHDMGYELTGIELDPEYYANAIKRIREHQRQLTINL